MTTRTISTLSDIPPEHKAEYERCLAFLKSVYGERMWATDNLIAVMRNRTWEWDEKYMAAFHEFIVEEEEEKRAIWRMHGNVWAAGHCLHVPGDFVECGVFRGHTAAVICRYHDFASVPKRFYLYDTFAGLPETTSTEKERSGWDKFKDNPDQLEAFVRDRFKEYPNAVIVKGIVPQSFAQAVPDKIAYLHIDMNSEAAEMGALEWLFDRVSPSGFVMFDDFGRRHYRNQTVSQLKFMLARGHHILELPTGQGMVVKHG